jgi:nickel-type superoxide dismutase maturation protease
LKEKSNKLRVSNLIDLFLCLLNRLKRFRIVGNSMLPLLKPGDEVLVNFYAYQSSSPQIGDIVVLKHPEKPDLIVIKRIIDINQNGEYCVQGDNSLESTDSRHFGLIKRELILGKVVCFF